MSELVILRRYDFPHEGEVALALLDASGIEGRLFGTHVADVAVSGPSPVVLRVRESDLEDAELVLRTAEQAEDDPSDDHDAVRCPRCELEYCEFGYRRSVVTVPGAAFWSAVWHRIVGKKRWHCTKCKHVWDDENEGPKRPSRFAPDDPRPVFVLTRHRGGMGAFLGLMAGYLLSIIDPRWGALPMIAGFVFGLILGRTIVTRICSAPACRTPLRAAKERCPGCNKMLAGKVSSAAEHYAAVAEVRRELAALRDE